ncbi:hypothetical protein LMG29542_07563 [Paraburkholderia humisilvae]|uniref:Uncharacterized protein n=1 Tax=Paraburkholderia humisilvae TaxID=627669 RepID=A0A6J5F8D9_9BURK|nr:hypothetical protein LMG29542_07563 [Paraburkholderia humisilvae]
MKPAARVDPTAYGTVPTSHALASNVLLKHSGGQAK